MDKIKNITNIEHIKILMDQKRQDVLQVLREADTPMTAKQIADRLGLNPATVIFHTNKLCDIGVLHVVKTELIHGIVAKYLEPTAVLFKIIANASDKMDVALIRNKMAKIAAIQFDQAKNDYMESCAKKGSIVRKMIYKELYMDFEEYTDFINAIDQIVSKHVKQKNPEQIRYRFLSSIVSDDDNLRKGKSCC